MWILLLWMCFLCASPGRGGSDRVCPRKEPPPGVVVISPGRELVLTCGGHVTVDGVHVNLTRKSPDADKKSSLNVTPDKQKITSKAVTLNQSDKNHLKATAGDRDHPDSAVAAVSTNSGPNMDPAVTASPDLLHTSRANTQFEGESDWEGEEMEMESDYADEDGEEGNRVTRGLRRSRPQWSWNKTAVGRGDPDWGAISFGMNGASLSLSPVKLTDSGKYACHYRGRERFSVKVIVADPPESPSLFCYKKSPSSKIRCEWTPQRPVVKHPHCYLLLSKIATIHPTFRPFPCSYSSQRSRCWCALDYNDEEQRTLHMAYLCVTSITGSATSNLLHFTPLDILKPDPPSNVSVQQEEGHQSRMKVSWNLPSSWKPQDSHYILIYELQYRSVKSSLEYTQKRTIEGWRSYTITDAIPGVEYMIELRAKDEYDGQWSDWTMPVYERSWTVAVTVIDDLSTPVFDFTDPFEDSDSGSDGEPVVIAPEASEGPHFALWIVGVFVLLSLILTAYIFRHKNRFLSKLHLSVTTQFASAPPPPPVVAAAPEGQALVTFDPPISKEEEEEETQQRMEGVHFNNTSYFFLQTE